jgi:FkbM family methyltransferase
MFALVAAVVSLSTDRVRLEREAAEPCPACPPPLVFDRPFRPVDFTSDLGGGVRYTGHSGNFIDFHILMYGAYEKPLLHFLRDVLEAVAPGGGVFLDVGANTGQHSLFLSQHAEQVHAFEPYEPVLERFRQMVDSNRLENVRIHPVGLGDQAAEIPFHEPNEGNLGTGSFLDGFGSEDAPVRVLRIVVGDEALASAGVERVHVIKLDVEGYERPALAGLRKTLEHSRPVIALEVTIDPELDRLFTSEADLASAFPDDYSCRAFGYGRVDLWRGGYRLVPCEIDFGRKHQRQLVWYPSELAPRLPVTAVAISR